MSKPEDKKVEKGDLLFGNMAKNVAIGASNAVSFISSKYPQYDAFYPIHSEPQERKTVKTAKESFNEIGKILADESKSSQEKQDAIKLIRDDIEDFGLRVFADTALNVMRSEKIGDEDKTKIIKSLKQSFNFLDKDDYQKKSIKEISNLTLGAFKKSADEFKDNPDFYSAIQDGMQNNTRATKTNPQEESQYKEFKDLYEKDPKAAVDLSRKTFNDRMESASDLTKTAITLTLFMAITGPVGLALAVGFGYASFYKDKEEPAKKRPDYTESWRKFSDKQTNELGPSVEIDCNSPTDKQRKEAKDTPTHVGKAANEIIANGRKELEQDAKELNVTNRSLGAVTRDTTHEEMGDRTFRDKVVVQGKKAIEPPPLDGSAVNRITPPHPPTTRTGTVR